MSRPDWMPKLDPGQHDCPTCGEVLERGVEHATVARVVRKGQQYGQAKAGQSVQIEPRHITPHVEAATMSLEERDMLEAHAAKAREAKPLRGRLADAVNAGLEAMIAATKAEVARGKAAAEVDAILASQVAAGAQ